jgi:hypothetical protein
MKVLECAEIMDMGLRRLRGGYTHGAQRRSGQKHFRALRRPTGRGLRAVGAGDCRGRHWHAEEIRRGRGVSGVGARQLYQGTSIAVDGLVRSLL